MTVKTKIWIGHSFLITLAIVISICVYLIAQKSQEIREGQEAVILELNGDQKGPIKFNPSYRYYHGVDLHGARECEEGEEADFTVSDGSYNFKAVYDPAAESPAVFGNRAKLYTLTPVKQFNGKVTVKHNFCGCEGMANLIVLLCGFACSVFLVLAAALFYYLAKRQKKKEAELSNQAAV